MIDRVRTFISDHRLLDAAGGAVIVALSGGADSVALLGVLTALGYDCIAAHCNFGLRGAESDRDEEHARAVARRLGARCVSKRFDVVARMAAAGESVEMACRALRYRWFEELRRSHGAQAIAVGHHSDDSVETFFLNLVRGSGIDGLAGIRPANGYVRRPLLCVSRSDILGYLDAAGLTYVTDSTNGANDYRRNRVRNIVMPVIRESFADADRGITASLGYISQARGFVAAEIGRLRGEYIDGEGTVEVGRLHRERPDDCRFVMFEMLKEQGMKMAVVEDIFRSVGESGRIFDGRWLLDRGCLRPYRRHEAADAVTVDLHSEPFALETLPASLFDRGMAGDRSACFDAAILEGDPVFTLRRWREGDRIAPFGMRGTKKLSDLYRDARLSVADKERAMVLLRDDVVIWAIGVRASRHYAVTPSTDKFIRLSYNR